MWLHVNATSEARHPAVKLRSGREGFADIDTGIRDSIRDIGQEVWSAGFSDVNAQPDAAVPLKA